LAASEDAAALVPRARRTGYRPLLAEGLLASATVKAEGGARDSSVEEATEAVFDADVGRADAVRAQAATRLLQWATDAGHRADAERWSRVAEAALDRGHDDGDDRVAWFVASALALEEEGKFRESKDKLVLALSLARRAGSSPGRIADTERMLAGKLAAIGEVDEAERVVTEANESIRRTVGEDHPARIPYLLTMGYVASERADYKAGLASTREAIRLAERISPDHNRLPLLYSNESNFLFELHDHEGALAAGDRTVASGLKVFGPDSLQVAYGYSDKGNALVALARYGEAGAEYERAVALHDKSGSEEPDLAQALIGWGRARTRAGAPAASIPMLERALVLMAKTELTGMEGQRLRADAQFALAEALWESGSRGARSAELAQAALATQRATKNASVAREVESWLEHHAISGGPAVVLLP
jgi:tetratricopeptide (TPR) repeat protein